MRDGAMTWGAGHLAEQCARLVWGGIAHAAPMHLEQWSGGYTRATGGEKQQNNRVSQTKHKAAGAQIRRR
eukprot:5126137-Pyramimonas_sp.AAC.2